MTIDFQSKQLSDPVYGVVGISPLEGDILTTRVFQRLHNVKQLGLGATVYPGANYSRFAHSVGACHLAGEIVKSISRNAGREFSDAEVQQYRLAGLLHDIGHYPFSHTFEHAIKNYYSARLTDVNGQDTDGSPPSFDHERMGHQVILLDPELQAVFKKHGVDPDQIVASVSARDPDFLSTVISSDLDCDRLDYLVRTALHAGLPYGRVDVQYIVSQMTLDDEGFPCLSDKAVRAADHLLISRYFDFVQLPFHKTVCGMEIALESVIEGMLTNRLVDCSASAMRERVEQGKWARFDDHNVTQLIEEELNRRDNETNIPYYASLKSLVNRTPPVAVFQSDHVLDSDTVGMRETVEQLLQAKIEGWASKAGVDAKLWRVWKKNLGITKMGSKVRVSAAGDDPNELDDEARTQLVQIQGGDRSRPTKAFPLIRMKEALVSTLSNQKFSAVRVYVNLSLVDDRERKKNEIREMIRADVPHLFAATA